MKFNPPLQQAVLIKRYKRFLADVTLANGDISTIHVANTGAMTGCADSGDIVWYSTSNNPKRKLPFSWELCQKKNNTGVNQGDFICVNTLRANQVVEEALRNGVIKEFPSYKKLQKEVRYGNENSRIDFLLTLADNSSVYIEVKSVTLLAKSSLTTASQNSNNQQGYFPDAVTARGQKHLRELIEIVNNGQRAVLFYAVLHSGIKTVSVAQHIDPKYAALLKQAINAGVEILVYQANINHNELTLNHSLPFLLA